MILEIPIEPDVPHQRFSVPLEGRAYLFEVQWNGRTEGWFMDVFDAEESIIVRGLALVLGTVIGAQCADDRFPPGLFFMSDTARTGLDANVDDLGARVKLYYVEDVDSLATGVI
jgi:hypothetical protein